MEDQESSLTTKDSNTSIASDINKLEIASQNTEITKDVELKEIAENAVVLNSANSSNISETAEDVTIINTEQSPSQNEDTNDQNSNTSSSSEESSSTEGTEPSSTKEEQLQKRKRKRKRRQKRKAVIAAYTPDEPFTKRYKKTLMELSIKPKLHVKFDESGNVISYQNNYKPRIISALPTNLSVTESTKEAKAESIEEKKDIKNVEEPIIPVISLKPRIIKAIGT